MNYTRLLLKVATVYLSQWRRRVKISYTEFVTVGAVDVKQSFEVLPQVEIPVKRTQEHQHFAITTGVRLRSHTNDNCILCDTGSLCCKVAVNTNVLFALLLSVAEKCCVRFLSLVLYWGMLLSTAQWRHNELDGVSNNHPHYCLINCLFTRRSKKTSKLRFAGLVRGIHRWLVNSLHKGPVTRKIFSFDDVIII